MHRRSHAPRIVAALAGLLLAASAAPPASAGVVYTYTGAVFTGLQDSDPPSGSFTTSMRVSGFVEVASEIPPFFAGNLTPVSFWFTDGRNVFTSEAPPGTVIFHDFVTDGSGHIESWNVWLQQDSGPGDTRRLLSGALGPGVGHDEGIIMVPFGEGSQGDAGWNNSQPGSWTRASTDVPGLPVPGAFRVSAGFPNPSPGSVHFDVQLDRPSAILVEVFDVTGRRVAGLDVRSAAAGSRRITLDGLEVDGRPLPGGVYLARLRAAGEEATRKLVIAR